MKKLSVLLLASLVVISQVQAMHNGGGKKGGKSNGARSGVEQENETVHTIILHSPRNCWNSGEQDVVGKYGEKALTRGSLRTAWQDLDSMIQKKPENFVALWSKVKEINPSYCPIWGGDEDGLQEQYLDKPSADILYILRNCTKLRGKEIEREMIMVYPPELKDLNNMADPYRYTKTIITINELPGYQDPAKWLNSVRSLWGRRDRVVADSQYRSILLAYANLRTNGKEEVNRVFDGMLAEEFTTEGYCREEVEGKYRKKLHVIAPKPAKCLAKLKLIELSKKDVTEQDKDIPVVMHDAVLNVLAHTHPDVIETLRATKSSFVILPDMTKLQTTLDASTEID
ncbi:hypothetical protein A3F06_00365 [candidate division TM6 bacterium RIFCSPHIGHO2_12_FULL_36_22]|nr:MAG: hypothetical protein A3F06_00365 [candidate division TM6 bacterium RIFCSPHIGHO2_12_FULL_36_22]